MSGRRDRAHNAVGKASGSVRSGRVGPVPGDLEAVHLAGVVEQYSNVDLSLVDPTVVRHEGAVSDFLPTGVSQVTHLGDALCGEPRKDGVLGTPRGEFAL